jgi:hypothetical protein
MLLFINCDVVNGNHAFKGFDLGDCFLQRLHRFHVKHRIVDALGDGAKVVAVFVAVGGFADEARGDEFSLLGDKTDLGVGLTFFEVVVTDLKSLQVVPLGVGVNDVLFQLEVGDCAVAVVGVDNVCRLCRQGGKQGRLLFQRYCYIAPQLTCLLSQLHLYWLQLGYR